ncbi:MAG: hypothetical protein K2X27_00785 [Candidatus Obscuribacterales bacterium]|nr:hypothetical protein [Candidatus Obscuribacterales bacterium]
MRAVLSDLAIRIFVAFFVAVLCNHEFSLVAGIVSFVCVFLLFPKLPKQDLILDSGHKVKNVRPHVIKYLHGDFIGQKILLVSYESCSRNLNSQALIDEFQQLSSAVFRSCEQMHIKHAEISLEIPGTKAPGEPEVKTVYTAVFAGLNGYWQELEDA